MPLKTGPLPQVATPKSALPADIAQFGAPIPAIERLRLMSSKEWEDFVLEWGHSLKGKYQVVERCGGPGDMGCDVIGREIADQNDPWDNYQCKHYDHALQPNDVWPELGKLCYYTFIGEYSLPREYLFVAPQGVGNALTKLLRSPDTLKHKLLAIWDEKCKTNITSTKEIPLDTKLINHIRAMDFSRIKALQPLRLIEEHRKTPWHAARFGGGLPLRPPVPAMPLAPTAQETNYIRALLDAYEDKLHRQLAAVADVPVGELGDHLRRSRHEFYNAEALREFSKDNVPPGTFESLLDEVHDGVIDTVQATHDDSFERVLAAVRQAKALALTANALVSRVTSSDKGGMCHELANDERIKWRK